MPKINTEFGLEYSDYEKIRQAILRCGYSSEETINNYLHNTAGKKITKSIDNYIPRSPRTNVIHAKGNNWSEQNNFNLAVNIGNSLKGKRGTSFYYLYYVVTGTGTNAQKGPRDFMSQGLNQEYNNIVDGLINELDKNIEKEMNI